MANTMEAAPRSPAQEIIRHCLLLHLKGFIIRNTVAGRMITVSTMAIARDTKKICGSLCGKDKSPSKKNRTI